MRTKKSNWFETKIRYEKVMEDGLMKKVTELYVVDALSHTEAEKRITEEMSSYISGDFDVKGIVPASYREIFFSDDLNADRFFKAKLQFITIDENTAKEKKTNVYYLVQATDIHDAIKNIDECMRGTLGDFTIASVAETQILDVYEYKNGEVVDGKMKAAGE